MFDVKKLLALICIALAVVTTTVGCGDKKATTKSGGATGAT